VANHQLIRASAGSGKTYRLSGHFLRQLFLKNPPETILATTFTRKAAGEILGRVLTRLAKGAESDAEATKLAAALELPQLTAATASELLTQLTRNLHRMRVCTLDSYFQQAARSMTLELGLMPGWSILDEHLDQELREQSIDAVLSQQQPDDAQNLMHMLAKGHSKRSVRELIDSTVRDFHELFQRTTEGAWQLIPAGRRLTEDRQQQLLNAMLNVELTDKRFIKARDADIQRFRDRDWDGFAATGMAKGVLSGDCKFYGKPISDPLCDIYRELNQHAAAELLQRWSQQMQAIRSLIARFDREYAKLRTEQGWMRFGDVTRVLAQSAAADGERLNFRLDSSLRSLLLDEFQDTSSDQWAILRRLTESIVSQGSRGSIFCVGDGKQAIYGWRGGVAEILDAVADAVPGILEAPLNQSRRSSAVVIETVNRVFMNLHQHGSLEELQDACHKWSARFPEHSTVHTELPGRVEFRSSPLWETEDSQDKQEKKGSWYRWVAEQIQEQHQRTPGATIGVLTRDNRSVSWLVYELTLLGVPASEEGGTPPIDSPAVLAVMSALQLAAHPACTVSRFHVANSPLGPVIGLTDWEDDELAVRVADSLRRKLLEDGYGNTLEEWARAVDADCSARDRLRLSQVAAEGWSFEELGSLNPSDFVRLLEQSRFQRSEPAPVRVMTVHQSKGLEFDIVVLPQLDAKLFKAPQAAWTGPSPADAPDRVCIWVKKELRPILPANLQEAFADTTARMVTESLCLFYVALTRARHSLLLLTPPITQKELPATYAGLLMATLTDRQQAGASELLYESGAENWSEHLPQFSTPAAAQITPQVAAKIPAIRLAKSLPCRERGLPRRTPSQHDRVPAAAVSGEPGTAGASGAGVAARAAGGRRAASPRADAVPAIDPRLRGIVFHAGFEALEWLTESETPDPALLFARLQQQVRDQSLTSALLKRLVDEFLQSLKLPAVRRIFNRDILGGSGLLSGWCDAVREGRADVLVDRERSFVRIHNSALIQGTIDRLVLVREAGRVVAADVVDFKTDRISGDADVWRKEKAEHYAGQLEEYRSAVRHMTSSVKLPVSTRLLLIEDASVVEVAGA